MSKLDSYISKLLSDDDALQNFLVDPIKAAEDENGLTKGQRSVLRRVVANLSNNSTNGYGIVRHLDSYRRSIRLLQNVLHIEQGAGAGAMATAVNKDAEQGYKYYYIYLYYNGNPSSPGSGNPYANYILYYSYAPVGATLEQIMNSAYSSVDSSLLKYNAQYYPSTGTTAVVSFTINGQVYKAAPQDPNTSRAPFWYFTQGGNALVNGYLNPYAYSGSSQNTFETYVPSTQDPSSSIISWQCIAPDVVYGFDSCKPSTTDNVFK